MTAEFWKHFLKNSCVMIFFEYILFINLNWDKSGKVTERTVSRLLHKNKLINLEGAATVYGSSCLTIILQSTKQTFGYDPKFQWTQKICV